MIFGIFGGKTPEYFKRKFAEIEVLKTCIDDGLSQAMADRSAAIRELSDEMKVLGELKAAISM